MTINLLPWREKNLALRNYRHFSILLIVGLILFLILIISKLYLKKLQSSQIQSNQKITQQIEALKSTTDLENAEKNSQILQQQTNIIQLVNNKQLKFWQEYSLLCKIIPNTVEITKISWDQHKLMIEGHSLYSEQISKILKILTLNQTFTSIQLILLTQRKQDYQTHFMIQAQHSLEIIE